MSLRGTAAALLALAACGAYASEVIPPAPSAYFNDYASVASPATARALNARLEQFEKATSNQLVVAIFPRMQSDSSVEDYTVRVAQAWKVGTAEKKNGAVLFVFVASHKVYLQVGYGLEGALPDALARRIIAEQITPRFKAGEFDAGLTAGVDSIIAATKGEYRGTGRTVGGRAQNPGGGFIVLLIVVIVLFSLIRSRASSYHGGGRRGIGGFMPIFLPGAGGGFGGGGGGFSGGGGSFGGGGAGGSW